MSLQPSEWSVVVVGHWNRAILTPSGIAKRLFELPEETPVEVMVPIDAIAPAIVKYDNIQVIASSNRLTIQPVVPSFPQLERAMQLATRAVTDLPQTPLLAAGFNIRYLVNDSPASLQIAITHDIDSHLADIFTISGRTFQRSLEWNDGTINLSIERKGDGDYAVKLNFDLSSPDIEKLKRWLQTPIDEVEEASRRLVQKFLGLKIEENGDGDSE